VMLGFQKQLTKFTDLAHGMDDFAPAPMPEDVQPF